jgi:ACS family hexuronate transporter-like MFS transporter
VAVWLVVFRRPEEHPCLTSEERALIANGEDDEAATAVEPLLSESARWKSILTSPAVWALMLARLLTDPVWYFFQFWMPKYLHSARGFLQQDLAQMWMIYLAADIGFIGSGFISGWLIRRGGEVRNARLRTMLGCAVLVPFAPLIALSANNSGVFAVSMVVVLAHTAWLASISTYVVDLVPKPILGTAFGLIAAGSAVGGILMNQAVSWTITHFSYDYCFYAMVGLHPLAFLLLWRFARRPWVLAPA